ncbi:MAG: hypothetical protein LBQ61_06440 [Spirochaetales bacterium]|jgi:hypothetical protein|nr:hypothetical protein [Spirochaetales bacterium]
MPEFIGDQQRFSAPYGLRYGGDSHLIALKGEYETERLKINGLFELLLQGYEGRAHFTGQESTRKNGEYYGAAEISVNPGDPNFVNKWLLSEDVKPVFMMSLGAEWGILPWVTAYAGMSLQVCSFLPLSYNFGAGATFQF